MKVSELCECFKELIRKNSVGFYSINTSERKILIMPHIFGTDYRFNVCPCCQKEVRNLDLTVEELQKITNDN